MTIRTISNLTTAINSFVAANNDSIFKITASINLNNSTVTMPANSMLLFENGGRIYGGTFVGQKAINKYVDVQWFASPSGADASSLAMAIALNDNVLISCTCTFGSTFTINRSGVRIFGHNPNNAVLSMPEDVTHFLMIAPHQSFITIENVTLKGYQPTPPALDLRKTSACHLFYAGGYNNNILIKGCIFDSGTSGMFVMPNSQFVTVDSCVFRNMVFIPDQKAGSYGVVFHRTSDGKGTNHIIVRNCIFEKTVVRHAVYIQSSNDVLIKDNIIYGTTEFNDSLIDKYYQYATYGGDPLTTAEIASFDVTKHMTRYDSAINYHGCTNVRIINNYFEQGITVLNGTTSPTSNPGVTLKGKFYLLKDNVIKSFCIPPYNSHPSLYNWDSIDNYRMIDNVEIDNTLSS